ncbi:hypothetical protein SNE40_011176 [Patella caerulea]|uniref:Tesmin/TSO1-like CXC domain-containing protein n=1 Tax=Patella caerulea TaxID=87958 RepID=A0AAN8PP01_PATCE
MQAWSLVIFYSCQNERLAPRKREGSGTSKTSKDNLDQKFAKIFFLHMLFLDVTLHPEVLVLAKDWHCRNCKLIQVSEDAHQLSVADQQRQKSLHWERKLWCHSTVANQSLVLTICVIRVSVRRFPPAVSLCSPKSCLQQQQQPNNTLRVHYQVRDWMGDWPKDMLPQDLGWELRHDHLYPVYTLLPPAQADLLRVVDCNCKTECVSWRCSCKKHGLECSPGCGHCRGVSCTNSMPIDFEADNTDVQ